MKVVTSVHVEQGGAELQDRAKIFHSGGRKVIAVADGVGGIGGGNLAADTFVSSVQEAVEFLTNVEKCRRLVTQVDLVLASDLNGPETTGIIAVLDSNMVFGAACGDTEARIFEGDRVIQVTPSCRSKSFLGSGNALVTEFAVEINGTLIIATDGLWKYANSSAITKVIRTTAPERLAGALADLPRLRSGNLPDDIAVVTCVRL